MPDKPRISFFCPAYHDAGNIEQVIAKASALLPRISSTYEILIIDDGSPDRLLAVVAELQKKYAHLTMVSHPQNRGYGAAMATGLDHIRPYDIVCFTDGDNQYDFNDIERMLPLLKEYDLVISYRITRAYGFIRKIISKVYYLLVTRVFRLPYRDVSSSTKIMKGSILKDIDITSTSPFANAELIIKANSMGYKINEVAIESYPRQSGRSSSVKLTNIWATWRDLWRMRRWMKKQRGS